MRRKSDYALTDRGFLYLASASWKNSCLDSISSLLQSAPVSLPPELFVSLTLTLVGVNVYRGDVLGCRYHLALFVDMVDCSDSS